MNGTIKICVCVCRLSMRFMSEILDELRASIEGALWLCAQQAGAQRELAYPRKEG